MTYTLDTNAVAAILREDQPFIRRVAAAVDRRDRVTLNAVSYFETKRGLVAPMFGRKLEIFGRFVRRFKMLPLDLAALDAAADIYADLRRKGTPLEDADILVAGIALAQDAVLITRNLKHFRRIGGLRLESWEA